MAERLTLREQLALQAIQALLDPILDAAFAPLAACRAPVSAARVRAAARWGTAGMAVHPQGWSRWAILSRLTGYAAGVALLLYTGMAALEAPSVELRVPSVIEAYFRAQPLTEADQLRRLRLAQRSSFAATPDDGADRTVYVDRH